MSRDIQMLTFIWKWKMLPSSALHKKYFSDCVPRVGYNRLWKLTSAGYLRQIPLLGGRYCAWGLDRAGFALIKSRLPPLANEGFRSEKIEHDLIVTAAQVGEHLLSVPPEVETVSEQELRNLDSEALPLWVPLPKTHRSDGYWRSNFNGVSKIISLEVEMNQKNRERYEVICDFYHKENSIDTILWIVNNDATSAIIRRQVSDISTEDLPRHVFVNLNDFLKNQWDANAVDGTGQNMRLSLHIDQTTNKSSLNNIASSLLDFRKCPVNQDNNQSKTDTLIFI
jgi:hypothetical protein